MTITLILTLTATITVTLTATVNPQLTATITATVIATFTATITALSSVVIHPLFLLSPTFGSLLHYVPLITQFAACVRYGRSSPKHLDQYILSILHKTPGNPLVTIDTPSPT